MGPCGIFVPILNVLLDFMAVSCVLMHVGTTTLVSPDLRGMTGWFHVTPSPRGVSVSAG